MGWKDVVKGATLKIAAELLIHTSGWVETHLTRAHLHAVVGGAAARANGTTARRI